MLKINGYEFDVRTAEMNFGLLYENDNNETNKQYTSIFANVCIEFYPSFINDEQLCGNLSFEIVNFNIRNLDDLVGKKYIDDDFDLVNLSTNHYNVNNTLWHDELISGDISLEFLKREDNRFLIKFKIDQNDDEKRAIKLEYDGYLIFTGAYASNTFKHEENIKLLSQFFDVNDYYDVPLITVKNNYKSVKYIPKK